jgi:glycolate oxidase FAD binding subunit
LILEPATAQELARALAEAGRAGTPVYPRGGGTKAEWGNPPEEPGGSVLSTLRLNRVIEHAWADLTVTVEAGCTVAGLQRTLAEHGQRLAVDPLWPERATIGGILATNDSGALRLRFGSLRDLIIGITVALPDGRLASSGGKVVKNVAGYDLPKLMTGAFGTLGVITQAVFRLHPVPHHTRTLNIGVSGLDEAQRLLLAIQDSQLAHSALQLRAGENAPPQIDVLLEGSEAGIGAQHRIIERLVGQASEAPPDCWSARERLWPAQGGTIVKFACLPTDIQATLETLEPARAVVQAIGIGYAKLNDGGNLPMQRELIEARGGSLMILTPSPHPAWSGAGDALPLMRALKKQFDPNRILNPGRFVGGI